MNHSMPVVLLVEDEPQIRRFTGLALKAEGWQVFQVDTLRRGLIEAGTRTPDMVVLDLGLPGIDGLEVIAGLRGWTQVPIVVLSARGSEPDKVAALDAGADDYVAKPFGMDELLARLRAAVRRSVGASTHRRPRAPRTQRARTVWHDTRTSAPRPRRGPAAYENTTQQQQRRWW